MCICTQIVCQLHNLKCCTVIAKQNVHCFTFKNNQLTLNNSKTSNTITTTANLNIVILIPTFRRVLNRPIKPIRVLHSSNIHIACKQFVCMHLQMFTTRHFGVRTRSCLPSIRCRTTSSKNCCKCVCRIPNITTRTCSTIRNI